MSTSKRYITVFGVVAGAGIIVAGTLIFLVDPFFHYHMPWFGLKPVVNNESYQNPGLAKHASYDSIIIGSSMTENFDAAWFDEAYDIHTLKLNYAGANAENLRVAVEAAQDSKKGKLKYVFGCLNKHILMVDSSEPAYSLPEYLYDNRLYNDVYYLLNKDVLFQDITTVLEENANGTVEPMNKINSWYEGQKERFSRENVLRSLGELPDTFVKVEQQEAVVLGETVDSVKKVKDFVQKYPETTFQFFYSPYSMAYWYTSYAAGIFLRDAENLEYSMKELLECKNVKLYFPFDYKMMSDFDHYKDWGHYDMEIQYQIFEKMVKGEDMLTMENYHDYMEEFRWMVMECDFEELFYTLDE